MRYGTEKEMRNTEIYKFMLYMFLFTYSAINTEGYKFRAVAESC